MDIKIKIPKAKKSFKKGSLVINPEAYWNAILLVGMIIVLFAFAFGFVLFRKVSRDPGSALEGTPNGTLVREEKLRDTLEYFRERARKSAEVTANPSPLIDPSL